MQYTHTLKNNIYHSDKEGPPSFFHPDTNPVIPHALFYSVNKTNVLVVTVKLIWLLFWNKFSFNFVPTPRKSLRFTRFRRSYLNRPAVVLTNYCQSYTAFLHGECYLKWPRSFLFAAFCPQCICVVEYTWCSNVVNCKVGR